MGRSTRNSLTTRRFHGSAQDKAEKLLESITCGGTPLLKQGW
jgi:hypothetical protein